MRSSEKNRYQNCMTVSNIGLANILSDPFGKTATQIMSHVLSSEIFDEEVCKSLIKKSAKKKLISSLSPFVAVPSSLTKDLK